MDFFGHQDSARRRTSLLIVYYVLAVIMIIAAVYSAFAVVFAGAEMKTRGADSFVPAQLWNPELFLFVVIGTVALVASGTLYKIAQLGRGGEAVARMLGGRKIHAGTADPAERRFLNVVEEMAIASGTAVASVYVLDDEQAINAFAAGFKSSDAVVAATRGCIEKLSRDELQGVVAHEFSHILNGDMRLNIKLTGVLHGILLISLVGYWIMRSSGSSRGSSSRSKKGGGQIVILGLLLWIIGYIGVFFGKLIKGAVSRQREYLADASAVQFTRNPGGIAGALKKIGGLSAGSKIASPNAEQASHFFFANGLTSSFLSLFATHPPLDERIRRIDPSFRAGDYASVQKGAGPSASSPEQASAMVSGIGGHSTEVRVSTEDVVASVGSPGESHIRFASMILSSIPPAIEKAVRDSSSARAVIYALLISGDASVREAQLRHLASNAEAVSVQETTRLEKEIAALGPEYRLPLASIAVSALKDMTRDQYEGFIRNADWLAGADRELDLFEYALKSLIKSRLAPVFGKTDRSAVQYYDLKPLAGDACRLISCIAYWGADEVAHAEKAYAAGAARTGIRDIRISPVDQCGLDMVDQAIARIKQASPFIKKRILEGCIECVVVDGVVRVEESELVQAIADALDCPVPPLLAGSLQDAA